MENKAVNILFIGNSFTYFNDMPLMVEEMGKATNRRIRTKQITYGGYSLIRYIGDSEEAKIVEKEIKSGMWDYVVLQDQSRKPYDNKEEFLYAISELHQRIQEVQGKTVLYSTWSYKDHTERLASTGLTYDEMYDSLSTGYQEAASKYNTLLAEVGKAFAMVHDTHEDINLYVEDDFHPNINGSYLAASLFFAVICGVQNTLYVPDEISIPIAEILQQVVSKIIT